MNEKDAYVPPCDKCGGSCCKYVALEIGKPSCKTDYDQVRWYLAHKNVGVFVDHDKKWFVEFRTLCEKQDEKGLCEIYSDRPKICRDYALEEGDCEFYDSPYLEYFYTIEDYEGFLDERKINWKFKNL